ncbi:MAG: hypothetical protein QG668_258 [Patescibacteria group bacterium]|nr:hypothetical protein [Patescibacteria group bacterium]
MNEVNLFLLPMTKRRLIQASKHMREAESRIQPDAAWVVRTRQDLLKTIHRENAVFLRPTFKERCRSFILTFLPARTIEFVRGPVMAVLSVFGIVIGGSLASVSAAERSLPGDLLFPVKLAGEQARLMIANESPDKLKLKTEFVGKRMNEMKQIATNDTPDKSKRLKEAAGIVKKDLEAVKVQISHVASAEPSANVAKAARAFDEASTGLIKTAKEVQAIAPKDVRIEVTEVQVAAVTASVKAVQVMIDTHNDPASEGVITKEAIKKTIEDKVQVLQTGMEETQQKVVESEERLKASAVLESGSSTQMMVAKEASVTSTAAIATTTSALTQFNAAKETLEATKRLLETDDLSEMKEVLGEAAKAVSTFEKSVAKTLTEADAAQEAAPAPASVVRPSSTEVTTQPTSAEAPAETVSSSQQVTPSSTVVSPTASPPPPSGT